MVNQKELINRIAEKTGLYKKDIKKMLLAFKEVVYDVAEEGEELLLKELFTVRLMTTKGRNRYIAPFKQIVYQDEHKSLKIIPCRKLTDVVKKNQ